MVVLAGVLAHSAIFAASREMDLGVFAPWLLAFSSVFVGTLASQAEYQVWMHRFFWLMALLLGMLAVPEVIQAAAGQMADVPEAMREAWLIIAVAPVPIGLVLGVARVWL